VLSRQKNENAIKACENLLHCALPSKICPPIEFISDAKEIYLYRVKKHFFLLAAIMFFLQQEYFINARKKFLSQGKKS